MGDPTTETSYNPQGGGGDGEGGIWRLRGQRLSRGKTIRGCGGNLSQCSPSVGGEEKTKEEGEVVSTKKELDKAERA